MGARSLRHRHPHPGGRRPTAAADHGNLARHASATERALRSGSSGWATSRAVCDLNDENAQYLADEAQELLGTRPRVFNEMERMVREVGDLGAASVTTDAQSHHKVATAALELGLNVQCEKPIAVTMRGADMI